ncbi:MAG: glycerophosphodiester phosphodiesterase [Thermoanaerobaculales bacterium]
MKKLTTATVGLLLLTTGICFTGERPNTIEAFQRSNSRARVIAHRGFSGRAPENTLASISEAIAIGADMVEIDVTLTADGHVVVIHDNKVQRTTDGHGPVAGFTLAELQQLDAGSWFAPRFAGERIPTLDQVLEAVDGRILLNVEIKSKAVPDGVAGTVAAAIQARGMEHQVIVSSFSSQALGEMRSAAPEISTAVLYNPKLHRGMDPVEIVTGLGASMLNVKASRLTDEMLRRCREHGIPVGIYTIDKSKKMRRFLDRGVHAIITNRPDRMLEIVKGAPNAASAPALQTVAATP